MSKDEWPFLVIAVAAAGATAWYWWQARQTALAQAAAQQAALQALASVQNGSPGAVAIPASTAVAMTAWAVPADVEIPSTTVNTDW